MLGLYKERNHDFCKTSFYEDFNVVMLFCLYFTVFACFLFLPTEYNLKTQTNCLFMDCYKFD